MFVCLTRNACSASATSLGGSSSASRMTPSRSCVVASLPTTSVTMQPNRDRFRSSQSTLCGFCSCNATLFITALMKSITS